MARRRRVVPLFALLLVDLLDRPELLFELHPPILEPDLDLTFGQAEGVRDLDPPSSRQVMVEMELLLKLQCLEPRVSLSATPPRAPVRPYKMARIEQSPIRNLTKIFMSLTHRNFVLQTQEENPVFRVANGPIKFAIFLHRICRRSSKSSKFNWRVNSNKKL